MEGKKKVKAVSLETFVFLFIFIGGFSWLGHKMGVGNMFKTMMATAHDLLLSTVFLIMAMAVLAGAISGLLSEFGAIALINKIFCATNETNMGAARSEYHGSGRYISIR